MRGSQLSNAVFCLIAWVVTVDVGKADGDPELPLVSAKRVTRRAIVGLEVREYVELQLHYEAPVYARACQVYNAIYVHSAGKCMRCPPACILSSLLGRAPKIPGLEQSSHDCLCGLTFEELSLRAQGRPGDAGFENVQRVPPEYLGPPEKAESYATALWHYDAFMPEINCGAVKGVSEVDLLSIRRFGLNGLPTGTDSLYWSRRFDTAFGLEPIGALIANTSRMYDDRLVVFLLPILRTIDGRTRTFGLDQEQLLDCGLDFPNFQGPHGEPINRIARIRDVPSGDRPCRLSDLKTTRLQIDSVVRSLKKASRQDHARCREYWRTSEPTWNAPVGEFSIRSARPLFDHARTRIVGSLAHRTDYAPSSGSDVTDCNSMRWQLRLRANNIRERVLALLSLDAVNGCWDRMGSILQFRPVTEKVDSDACVYDSDSPEFWASPCCNPRRLRRQCCAVRQITVQKLVLVGVDDQYLAHTCRKDPTGRAVYANSAVAAALTWQRKLSTTSGISSCMKALTTQEQAHAETWRSLQRCHADVMGRYDRDRRSFIGSTCIVDEDCLTEKCMKPTIPSLKVFTSVSGSQRKVHQKSLIGRCKVPDSDRHEYLIKCIVKRIGPHIPTALAEELGLPSWQRNVKEVASKLKKKESDVHGVAHVSECIGPMAPAGVKIDKETCLKPKVCNWNHEITSAAECEKTRFGGPLFCSTSWKGGFQKSVTEGCIDGRVVNQYCFAARELLRQDEAKCLASAVTLEHMRRCNFQVDRHNQMMQLCLRDWCMPPESRSFEDEMCFDLMRRDFSSCHDQCNIPSGPNPSLERKVCYMELRANETEADCYNKIQGDSQVHWSNDLQNSDLTLEQRAEARPKYCSVRVWQKNQVVTPIRSRFAERTRLELNADLGLAREKEAAKRGEAEARQAEKDKIFTPPKPPGCHMGIVPLTVENKAKCQTVSDNCCLSPVNDTTATCEKCSVVNTTVCHVGQMVLARFPPNKRLYSAVIVEDVDQELVIVDWMSGERGFRDVPWISVFTDDLVLCTSKSDGCARHEQCMDDKYCFGCEACKIARGGNPPPELCAPCPTARKGACADVVQCATLQDAVNGSCPMARMPKACKCKNAWTVRDEYPGAPYVAEILSCFFDSTTSSRWCEVENGDSCGAQLILGKSRPIYWQECTPQSCDGCNCDCTSKCTAYDILPRDGRLPAHVVAGDLTQELEDEYRSISGVVGPICAKGSDTRKKGRCPFCTACCADYCQSQASVARTNFAQAHSAGDPSLSTHPTTTTVVGDFFAPSVVSTTTSAPISQVDVFDCTATNVTGCRDFPYGWMDSIGRVCADYERDNLCTFAGEYGLRWVYMPPRSFSDFSRLGVDAPRACCACGGGTGCSDSPSNWKDPQGYVCDNYRSRVWCNRTGYGRNWDASWGEFPLGSGGVDAITACCACGGGLSDRQQLPQLTLISDVATCEDVWPGRTMYGTPAWHLASFHYCRLLAGTCLKKLTAVSFDPSVGIATADLARVYGLCEQRTFKTGRYPYREDTEMENTPDDETRRLAVLDRHSQRVLTPLGKNLSRFGAVVATDWYGNIARGLCYYRLPDPLGLFGGPSKISLPPGWILHDGDLSSPGIDILAPPTLNLLGWPPSFYNAYPRQGEPLIEIPKTSTTSAALRGKLIKDHIELVPRGVFEERLNKWQAALDAVVCDGPDPGGPMNDLGMYRDDKKWQPAYKTSRIECVQKRCEFDDVVIDEDECAEIEGCTANCLQCAGSSDLTREQGLCYATLAKDVARCGDLGGILVDDEVFDDLQGFSRRMKVCALPSRPLLYCTAPGEKIRRCALLDLDQCESDPLALLLGCHLMVAKCKSGPDCQQSGRCSDEDLGLSWVSPGLCVMTPLDDDLVRQGCTKDGLCYSRLDPPFGMEVRWRHGILDLLDVEVPPAGSTPSSGGTWDGRGGDVTRLRESGRLSRRECEESPPNPGFNTLWLTKAISSRSCKRWRGCCLEPGNGRCNLFSGAVVDAVADPAGANASRSECEMCGGAWMDVFRWVPGQWHPGKLTQPGSWWDKRSWTSANTWLEIVEMDAVRQLFENSAEGQLGRTRFNAIACMVEPLLQTLEIFADACGDETPPNSINQKEEPEMPTIALPLGNVISYPKLPGRVRFSGVEVAWHEHTIPSKKVVNGRMTSVDDFWFEAFTEPLELDLGAAAAQLALPHRAEYVRTRLEGFALEDMLMRTTTKITAIGETPRVMPSPEGYPPALISAMIELESPGKLAAEAAEVEKAKKAQQLGELGEKSARNQIEIRKALEAKATAGLRPVDEAILTGQQIISDSDDSSAHGGSDNSKSESGQIQLDSEACRNSVLNPFGEIVGQLLGDCVRFEASTELANGVELCVPIDYPDAPATFDIEPWRTTSTTTTTMEITTTTTTAKSCSVSLPGGATWGYDIPGTNFPSPSWQECQSACDLHLVCATWHLQNNSCFLKREPAQSFPLVGQANSTDASGGKCSEVVPKKYAEFGNACADALGSKAVVDQPHPLVTSIKACRSMCDSDDGCLAFEFYPFRGPLIGGFRVRCLTASQELPATGSITGFPVSGVQGDAILDASCYIKEVNCRANFGSSVGDPVCCGQAGLVLRQEEMCPERAPVCREYVAGQVWGKCGGIRIGIASKLGNYAVVTRFQSGDVAMEGSDDTFKGLGSFLPASNFIYIRGDADDSIHKPGDGQYQFALQLPTPAMVYFAYYGSAAAEHSERRSWIGSQGWSLETSLASPSWTGAPITEIRKRFFNPGFALIPSHNGSTAFEIPLVFVRRIDLWPRVGSGSLRCSSPEQECQAVSDQSECQKLAIEVKYDFYDFDAVAGCCVVAKTCGKPTKVGHWTTFARPRCFGVNLAHVPLDMPGAQKSLAANPIDCQARCAARSDCVYFSWRNGDCHIQNKSSILSPFDSFITGAPACEVAMCTSFLCPRGYVGKPKQETLSCRASACTSADIDVCCNRLPGLIFDFAERTRVPKRYALMTPMPLATGRVYGLVGESAWKWRSNATFGRLLPGDKVFRALGTQSVLRRGVGGSQLCTKIFEENITYCPAVRIDTPLYMPLPRGPMSIGESVYTFAIRAGAPKCQQEDQGLSEWMPDTADLCSDAASWLKLPVADLQDASEDSSVFDGLKLDVLRSGAKVLPRCWKPDGANVVVWNSKGPAISLLDGTRKPLIAAAGGNVSAVCCIEHSCSLPNASTSLDSRCWAAQNMQSSCPDLNSLLASIHNLQVFGNRDGTSSKIRPEDVDVSKLSDEDAAALLEKFKQQESGSKKKGYRSLQTRVSNDEEIWRNLGGENTSFHSHLNNGVADCPPEHCLAFRQGAFAIDRHASDCFTKCPSPR